DATNFTLIIIPVGTNYDAYYDVVVSNTCGSTNSSAASLTVNTAAQISCPPAITVPAAAGQCSSNVDFAATATGTPTPVVEYKIGSTVITSPHIFPVGTNTVDCTASNGCGSATCSFTVAVVETEPPIISCPATVIANTGSGQCSASGVALGSPISSDNCAVANVVNNAPNSYPRGTNLVVWTVTDVNGNSSLCTQRVIVVDTQAPSLSCPLEVHVQLSPGQCCASGVELGMPST